MARLVSVSASDKTLWHLAAKYLNDPQQAGRIAQINNRSDFWLTGLQVPTELIIPDPDPSLTDTVVSQAGIDFQALFGISTPIGPPPINPPGPGAETLTIAAVSSVYAGQSFTVSVNYTGSPTSLDYVLDDTQPNWALAAGVVFGKATAVFSVPGILAGAHVIAVRDSNNQSIVTADYAFTIVAPSGNPDPIPPVFDPNNDSGGDEEDTAYIAPVPAPFGLFVFGVNCFAQPPAGSPTSDISPDIEALALPPGYTGPGS